MKRNRVCVNKKAQKKSRLSGFLGLGLGFCGFTAAPGDMLVLVTVRRSLIAPVAAKVKLVLIARITVRPAAHMTFEVFHL